MTPVTFSSVLLVEDPSSLKNLEHLVGISRTMMDHMLTSPLALQRFARHAFHGVSTRFLSDESGVVNTFDFSHHQAHPFSLSLVTKYQGGQEWNAKLHKTHLLARSLADRTHEQRFFEGDGNPCHRHVDGPWRVCVTGFSPSMLMTLAKYLQQVSDWSQDLSRALASPDFLQAAKMEKNARNGIRLVEDLSDGFGLRDPLRFKEV